MIDVGADETPSPKKRIAFYGGSFDPVHRGHIAIGRALLRSFLLDEFVFVPAHHAPHKPDNKPTSSFHRYAMLCLATSSEASLLVSRMELEAPETPFTVQTLTRLKAEHSGAEIFFVMGADSWQDIRTWREWETVLTMVSHIVVTRPGHEIGFSHIPGEIRRRIIDVRTDRSQPADGGNETRIYITDAVQVEASSSRIRSGIRNGDGWQADVPNEVAKYIEKYQIYK